ncbi:hypothetical protein [Actinacidiphila sp. bgisy160]|uniref:hypothetical protein n=1 Tax=Actinacidiphila sp. bgisy160 TaxID=3413796 RepID=UPI003D74520E
MRRTAIALSVIAAAFLASAPATAAPAGGDTGTAAGRGWEPVPSLPWDVSAGLRCDFPVHGEAVVDEVVRHVLDTYPDGSVKRAAYRGDLVVRVTNSATGASYDADAGGRAIVEYRPDGSQHWSVRGPVLVGFGQAGGTLARGLYIIDGVYTMDIGVTGHKTVTMVHASSDDLCARID